MNCKHKKDCKYGQRCNWTVKGKGVPPCFEDIRVTDMRRYKELQDA